MTSRKIQVFFHVVDINDRCQLITEKITNAMIESCLIDHAHVNIYCNYNADGFEWLHHKLKRWPLCQLRFPVNNPMECEVPTLRQLKQDIDNDPDPSYVLYLHLKGATQFAQGVTDWCNLMLYFTVTRWRDAILRLEQGYDTCGVNWKSDHKHPHYSGNFWWARSEYLKTLKPFRYPETISWDAQSLMGFSEGYRHDAEFWIGMNQPRACSLHDSQVNHYWNRYPEFVYREH